MALSDDNLEKLREIFGNVSIQDLKDIQFEFEAEADQPGALEKLEISQPHKAILIYRDKIESLQKQVAELQKTKATKEQIERVVAINEKREAENEVLERKIEELQEDRERLTHLLSLSHTDSDGCHSFTFWWSGPLNGREAIDHARGKR